MGVVRFVADEQALQIFFEQLKPFAPMKLKELWVEEDRCISIKCVANNIDLKIKFEPFPYKGQLGFKPIKVFAGGINVDISPSLGLFSGMINNFLKAKKSLVQAKIEGKTIVIPVQCIAAGISGKEVIISVRI